MHVLFEMDGMPETWQCAFCWGRFQQEGDLGIGWVSRDKMLCCSPVCATMRTGPEHDPPPFIDETEYEL
jgi:hypothetical protein